MKHLIVALALIAPASALAQAPRAADPATILRAADAEGAAGDWARAAQLVGSLELARLDRADLAEARRLRGLAAFFAGKLDDADAELFAWLELDLDARLDPAVTPPEAIGFLERVRTRHAAALRALRPKPHVWAANLLPPWGQFQNGDRAKGWTIAIAGGALLAADVGSYALLRRWCGSDLTCDGGPGSPDRTRDARVARTVNLVAGGALLAVYAFGVVDGLVNYHPHAEVIIAPTGDGAQVLLMGRF